MPAYGLLLLLTALVLGSAYEIGTTHKYSYETTVVVDEKCTSQSSSVVGHRLKAAVRLTAVWESPEDPKSQLIRIEILNPKLWVPKKSVFVEHGSELDKLSSSASYILWEDGVLRSLWDDDYNEHYSLRNLKRGIGSLLQYRKEDQDTKEVDVSGECDVVYKVKGNSVRRRKGNCVHSKFDKSLSQPHGVRSASVVHQSTADCEWKEGKTPAISSCKIMEYVKFFSNAWHRPSLCVDERSELTFEGTEKDKKTYKSEEVEKIKKGLEEGNLESILVLQEEKQKKRQLKSTIAHLEKDMTLESLAKMKSAKAFYRLLPIFRAASSGEILQVLNNDKLEDIIPQLIDLVSACATKNCLKAAFEFFEAEGEYNPVLERFLISLSILPRPSSLVVKELRSFLDKDRDEKIESTVLITLGTILKTYSDNHVMADAQLIEDTRVFLEKGVKECDEESESCALNYLRSIRNAANPRSAPLLLEYATQGDKNAMEAVLGLRNIPIHQLPPQNQVELLKVFNQIGAVQDRSTRAIAAELLLKQHPKLEVLKNILATLLDQSDEEFSTFLASKIIHLISVDPVLRSDILHILPDKDINYYYTLAQKGQSSLFRRPMVSLEGTNVTYGLELEMLEGGMLKRALFDVSFENDAGGASLLSVGLFARGLGALAGESPSTDEDASPTAGMELGFLDSSLRPYVFFKSMSELMGHAWSGTASEPIPVLQCVLAFSDDEKVVVLGNGMIVRGQMRGVLSTEATTSAKISLWNRNSKSVVKTMGALLVRGAVTLDAGFVVTQGTIQFTGESSIDFITDLDFYESPFTTCMQMEHPDLSVHFDVHRSTVVPETKYQLKRTKKRVFSIPGRSFAFHDLNNEMCQALNSDEDS